MNEIEIDWSQIMLMTPDGSIRCFRMDQLDVVEEEPSDFNIDCTKGE